MMDVLWLNAILAVVTTVLLSLGLRQASSFTLGTRTLRGASVASIAFFLAVWFIAQMFLGGILGFVLTFGMVGESSAEDVSKLLAENMGVILIVAQIISLVSVLLATFVGQRYLRKQPFLSIGLRRYGGWLWDLGFGLVLGIVGILLMVGIYLVSGQLSLAPTGESASTIASTILTSLIVFAVVAFSEEILVRGFVLQALETGWGTAVAALGSSLFWGLLHWANAGASGPAILNVAAIGMVYAFSYVATRSLWMPMALHFAWNFIEGPIFGFTVSGVQSTGLLSATLNGGVQVTGGDFGPEAGLLIVPVLIIQFLLIAWWTNFRKRFVAVPVVSAPTPEEA